MLRWFIGFVALATPGLATAQSVSPADVFAKACLIGEEDWASNGVERYLSSLGLRRQTPPQGTAWTQVWAGGGFEVASSPDECVVAWDRPIGAADLDRAMAPHLRDWVLGADDFGEPEWFAGDYGISIRAEDRRIALTYYPW